MVGATPLSTSSVSLQSTTSQREKPTQNPATISKSSPSDDVEKATTSSQPPIDDYSGPDDPLNPWNWSTAKRWWHVFPPAFISFIATMASSIYTPSYPEIMRLYHVNSTVALLPLSLYVLALAFGPIIGAPLSETYGRNFVYRIAPPIAMLFTLGGAFSKDITGLLVCRFFAGVFFSPALAIGAGTNADCFRPHERALPSVFYIIAPFLGSPLGPLIGGFVTVNKGWKWVQYTIIFFAVAGWILMFSMTETHRGTILKRRNKRLGLSQPASAHTETSAKIKFLITVTLFRPIHMLFTEPIVFCLSLYTAFNFGVLFTFFAAFPYTFTSVYGFSTTQNGLVFISVVIGVLISVPIIGLMNKILYLPHHHAAVAHHKSQIESTTTSASDKAALAGPAPVAPEHRLYPALLGSLFMPIGLFWFAWTARSDIHWIVPVLSAIPFGLGNLTIFMAAASYLVDTYGALNGASSLAANGMFRYGLGAAFPLFALQMYKGLGIEWATTLLGCVTLVLLPIPWVLLKYGHLIRRHSSYPISQ